MREDLRSLSNSALEFIVTVPFDILRQFATGESEFGDIVREGRSRGNGTRVDSCEPLQARKLQDTRAYRGILLYRG